MRHHESVGLVQLADHLFQERHVDRAGDDQQPVGSRIGQDLGGAGDQVAFVGERRAVAEARGDEYRAARAGKGCGSSRRSNPQHFVEDIGHLFRIGAIELNPFAGDPRRRHIDEISQRDQLADHADIFRENDGLGGRRGHIKSITGMRRPDLGENTRGFLRIDIIERHVIADDLLVGRQIDRVGIKLHPFAPRVFVGADRDDFEGMIIDGNDRNAIEQEGRVDQLDHLPFAQAGGVDAHVGYAVQIGIANQVLPGQLFVKIQNRTNSSHLIVGGTGGGGPARSAGPSVLGNGRKAVAQMENEQGRDEE